MTVNALAMLKDKIDVYFLISIYLFIFVLISVFVFVCTKHLASATAAVS